MVVAIAKRKRGNSSLVSSIVSNRRASQRASPTVAAERRYPPSPLSQRGSLPSATECDPPPRSARIGVMRRAVSTGGSFRRPSSLPDWRGPASAGWVSPLLEISPSPALFSATRGWGGGCGGGAAYL